MARRWGDPTAFRADPQATPALRPSWRQSVAMLAVLVVVAGVIAVVSAVIRPDRARAFDLLHGSILIGDQFGPVSVDLASGRGTLQIRAADQQAGVTAPGNLSLVPFDGGTLLLNKITGQFNMVDPTGFVVKRDGGVTIPGQSGQASAVGIAAGGLVYIERTGASGTDVLLVGPSTVATAAANPTSVKPRASYASQDQGETAAGGAASANGDLWALFRTGNRTEVRQFGLPANSSTGASLTVRTRGTVPAVSAIESATTASDGTGTDVIGVASSDRVRIYAADGSTRTETFKAPAGVDTILPTSSAQGRLSYLMHGTAGWYFVSFGVNGGVTGPVDLRTVEPSADLAPPAASLGAIYTMTRSGSAGTVYRVGPDGKVTAVAAAYPQKTGKDGAGVESASFEDGYLVAKESRVLVDSPGHYLALAVFTDGSSKPKVVEKTNLTSVNAAAGADALTQGPVSTNPSSTPQPTNGVKQQTAPSINNKINCKQVNQKPHVPQINSIDPAARSVGLSWVYPVLDSQDCLPSTYQVSVQLLSNNAPPAPGRVTLNGRVDTIISGLFPNTRYAITVTAIINGQSTPSQAVRVTTGKEGPAAPKSVSATTDSAGNWNITWDGCGSVAQKCVAVDSWTVRPAICDGKGLSASPAAFASPADSTSVRQPTAVFKGGDALLGRSLQFRVQGTGADGSPGDVSATSPCVQSWSPPDVSAMTLDASLNGTTGSTASVDLNLGANATHNAGGVGATVTFQLTGGGSTKSKTVTYDGRTSRLATTFTGLEPGYNYTAVARVSPPGHPDAAQSTPSKQLTTRADWPGSLGISATCPQYGIGLNCTLSVTFRGLSSAQAHGEQFTMTEDSGLYCGSSSRYFSGPNTTNIDPAKTTYTQDISLLGFGGNCTVKVHLVEANGTQDPKYFGGTTSPLLTNDVSTGSGTTLSASDGDFSVAWGDSGAVVKYTDAASKKGYTDQQVAQLTRDWSTTVIAPDGTRCGNSNNTPTHGGITVGVAGNCVNDQGDKTSGWHITISYTEQANGQNQSLPTKDGDFDLSGQVPGYVPPCTLSQSDFTAAWNTDASAPAATVSYDGKADVRGCSKLTYQLIEPQVLGSPKTCGDVTGAGALPDTAPGPVALAMNDSCKADISNLLVSYQIQITWNSQRDGDMTKQIAIPGSPPKA